MRKLHATGKSLLHIRSAGSFRVIRVLLEVGALEVCAFFCCWENHLLFSTKIVGFYSSWFAIQHSHASRFSSWKLTDFACSGSGTIFFFSNLNIIIWHPIEKHNRRLSAFSFEIGNNRTPSAEHDHHRMKAWCGAYKIRIFYSTQQF